MKKRKMYLIDCHLAGRKYHDANEVWDKLKIGTLLQLQAEPDNRYDPKAVMVIYRDEEQNDDVLLGYIPRNCNFEISTMLEMGWADIFECRINNINPLVHPEEQIRLTIKVKRNPLSQINQQ